MKPFIGIKRLWYSDPVSKALIPKELKNWLKNATEVMNVHDGTWGYSQDDPSVEDYKNDLNGQVYYKDKTDEGAKTITFSMGVYSWKNKADLQGGKMYDANGSVTTEESNAVGWSSDQDLENVNKTIVAQTKTGNYIVFSNASVVAKGDQQSKNITLGVTAVAMESDAEGVEGEYMWEGSAVENADTQAAPSGQKSVVDNK